jgi:hypothetical protein
MAAMSTSSTWLHEAIARIEADYQRSAAMRARRAW